MYYLSNNIYLGIDSWQILISEPFVKETITLYSHFPLFTHSIDFVFGLVLQFLLETVYITNPIVWLILS